MRNSPQKVGVSFLHDFPVSTLALVVTQFGRILQKVDFLENSLSLEMPVF